MIRWLLSQISRVITLFIEAMYSWYHAPHARQKKFRKESLGQSIPEDRSTYDKQKLLIKILRLLGFTMFLIGCLYQSGAFFKLFFQYPTSMETNIIHAHTIVFPAVTLCNGNRVRISAWCNMDPTICAPYAGESQAEYVTRLERKYDGLNKSTRIQLGHQKEEFIRMCQFEDQSCHDKVAWFYDYEYTNCFTVHAHWGLKEYEPLKATMFRPSTGRSSELSLLLDIEPQEYSPLTMVPRARMTIHANKIIPNPQYDAVSLQPGNIYSYGVQLNKVNVLASPYQTNCRNYTQEIEKRTGSSLTQEGCMMDCYASTHVHNCGCTIKRLALLYDLKSCETDAEANCIEEQQKQIGTTCFSACRMPCSKITYAYTSVDSFALTRGSCDNDEDEEESDNSTAHEEESRNLVCIRVYYASPEMEVLSHRPKYNGIEVFSVIGGYIGLWLGVSMLTVFIYLVKMIDYFVNRRKQ